MSPLHPRWLEPLKWLAFAAMVCDHVDLLLLDRTAPFLHQLGRFALPAFALCFGLGLAHAADPLRAARRLVAPATVAQLAWLASPVEHPANVLAVFALCAVCAWMWRGDCRYGAFGAVLLLGAWPFLEAGPLVPLLVAGGYAAAATGRAWIAPAAVLPMFAIAPSIGVLAAAFAPAVVAGARIVWRRTAGALAWAYAAHLLALVAIAAVRTS